MKVKNVIHYGVILMGGIIVVCLAGLQYPPVLKAETMGVLTEEQKQAFRAEVQNAIQKAETLGKAGKYDEALRVLFDVMTQEERMKAALFMLEGAKEVPIMSVQAMFQLEEQLMTEDQSPLMQWFRDPDIQLQEKLTCLVELRRFAEQAEHQQKEGLFRGKYRGTLVQLMLSPLLSLGEKTAVLSGIRQKVQARYTSTAERERIREEIIRLRWEADMQFRAQQYVEAFLLMDEASQKADDIDLSGKEYIDLLKQRSRMETEFVYTDQSPLMQVFKGQEMSTKEKQYLVYDLRNKVGNRSLSERKTVVIQGKEYDGTLVDILIHPRLHWMTKDAILELIDVAILQKEPDYVPEVFLGLEDYLKKQENNKE